MRNELYVFIPFGMKLFFFGFGLKNSSFREGKLLIALNMLPAYALVKYFIDILFVDFYLDIQKSFYFSEFI